MSWVRFALILVLIGVARADAGVPLRRVALVIGQSDYVSVPKLPNPPSDAEQIGAALRDVGFTKVTVAKNLTHVQFLRALRDFSMESIDSDWAVVYYAGHGLEVQGKNYLIPTDAELETDTDVAFEAVSMDAILASVTQASKLRLVILDACRDNPFLGKMRQLMATRSMARGLAPMDPQGDLFVVYSAQAGATALDGQEGGSPFVKSLLKNIRTPGLEINLLFRRVRADVMRDTNSKQEPAFEGSLPGEELYFREPMTTALATSVPPISGPVSSPTVPPDTTLRPAVHAAMTPVVRAEPISPRAATTAVAPVLPPKPESKAAKPAIRAAPTAAAIVVKAPPSEPDSTADAGPKPPSEAPKVDALLEEKARAMEVDPPPTVAAVQTELQRLGCEPGPADGNWTKVSRTALSKAGERLQVEFDLDHPDKVTLDDLRKQSDGICKTVANRIRHRNAMTFQPARAKPAVVRHPVSVALRPVAALPRNEHEGERRLVRPRPIAEARRRASPASSGCFVFNGQRAC